MVVPFEDDGTRPTRNRQYDDNAPCISIATEKKKLLQEQPRVEHDEDDSNGSGENKEPGKKCGDLQIWFSSLIHNTCISDESFICDS